MWWGRAVTAPRLGCALAALGGSVWSGLSRGGYPPPVDPRHVHVYSYVCVRASSELWKIAGKRGCGEGAHAVGWGGVTRAARACVATWTESPMLVQQTPGRPNYAVVLDQSGARLCGCRNPWPRTHALNPRTRGGAQRSDGVVVACYCWPRVGWCISAMRLRRE